MTEDQMKNLERGDIVKPCGDWRTFVVTGFYGDHAIAVAAVDITNPPEWELVRKAQRPDSK